MENRGKTAECGAPIIGPCQASGWRAMFDAVDGDAGPELLEVALWLVSVDEEGKPLVRGLVHSIGLGFEVAEEDKAFIGYVGPLDTPEDVEAEWRLMRGSSRPPKCEKHIPVLAGVAPPAETRPAT